MREVLLTAGRGPREVRRFVHDLGDWVLAALPDAEERGRQRGSVRLLCPASVWGWQGTHVLVDAVRGPGQRRRWFAAWVVLPEEEALGFDAALVRFETARAGGPGGQHVNTTSSAVRAVYPPLGMSVRVVDQRSQHRNRAEAVRRLEAQVGALRAEERRRMAATVQAAHDGVVRGAPVGRWRRRRGRLEPVALPRLAP